ncbi:helix-turn-helix transcriptional regulator [Microbacterium trichothecenolyticum]|uniref:DNA-binding CsgD family transcriptional regulator n=1 Tax=Microbacterium trichothecenolyticum TaxID=69370 RepID=A0ABU0TR38_MICTR|nr:helix-turn-helix transcriptional regulator [Microbacterium trichothecenolyticum]MDQ1122128.1 DNA-binding CsgD family transcriptional regulator [Microbacterium trichothecenolyticum]
MAVTAHTALRAATVLTLLRLVPGYGQPLPHHLAMLAEAPPVPAPKTWTDDIANRVSAMFAARARRDVLEDDVGLVDRYFDDARLRAPAELSAKARSVLMSSAAEYCGAIGRASRGARFGREALLFADHAPARYRALSTCALNFAVNGEYLAGAGAAAEAHQLFEDNGWEPADTSFLLLQAHMLMSAARMDATGLAEAADMHDMLRPDDSSWVFAAHTARVMRDLLNGDRAAADAASTQLLRGDLTGTLRMTRFFLFCLRADVLAAQHRFTEGLEALVSVVSPDGHAICFAMQRSACLLQLARERELLADTAPCLSHDDHCLRTLVPLLVRRAIAFQRIGEGRRAHQSMESALMLIDQTGNSTNPFIAMPVDETLSLIEGVVGAHPRLSPLVAPISAALERVGLPSRGGAVARLSLTERGVAEALRGSKTLREIAAERGVSLNTVKTQARRVYRKLGVSGREGVAGLLPRDGEA